MFVEVLDENDHTPLTAEPVYWVSVAENSPPRTAVARITSFDGDNVNAKLMYHLKAGNPQSLFDIDANTGINLGVNFVFFPPSKKGVAHDESNYNMQGT